MPSLSDADRSALLALARQAVVDAVTHARLPEQIPESGVFAERTGLFVTLHVRGRLRGCIGVVEADEPLGESTVRCAAGAATQDLRFPGLRVEELGDVRIEISLLSLLVPIRPEEIEIGRHGLLISRGRQRGLLLPQVAIEHRFAVERFLEETCKKAQLPPGAWREPGTQILGFTCEVFSEQRKENAVGS
jgi:AmmeMemoRadiSam system protein A